MAKGSNNKTIWMVYPYGYLNDEGSRDGRYVMFGKSLAKCGYKVIWWTANFSHLDKKYKSEGWKKIKVCENFITELVPTSSYQKNISFARVNFERAFARNLEGAFNKLDHADMIIVASTGMFNAFEPCYSYAMQKGIPLIYDIMDIPLVETYMEQHFKILAPISKVVMGIERKREENFFKKISGICALGKNQLEYAKHKAFDRNIPAEVVYNGIDVVDTRKEIDKHKGSGNNEKDGWIWCLYSGSMGPQYDIETIIDCAKLCEKNHDRIKFVVAGMGTKAELAKEADRTCKNFEYAGFLSKNQLAEVYSKCDVGLIAIKSYSTCDMPDKFYDYCAAGLGILNTLRGEVKEYIEEYRLGHQYEPENTKSLYNVIKTMTDSGEIKGCKERAYNLAMEFHAPNQVEHLTNMVNGIFYE